MRREMQVIFQDQSGSLDPRMKVGQLVSEPLEIHKLYEKQEREEKTIRALEMVGLQAEHLDRFPHEFSGGQRQRISIARALILNPKFVVADEPVSALDVSIRSEILNLLNDLQEELGLTFLLISHDLSVVKHMSRRIAVMYAGKVVEFGSAWDIFRSSKHPYTQALLSAIPIPDPDAKRNRISIEGEPSSPINPPAGCRFYARCPFRMAICEREDPELISVSDGHLAACHLNTK
jgi:oligopeptide/dipeptide ABC transporter ATP-binding protein